MDSEKKTLFSGIQPTGIMTLGNYLGAMKSWKQLQDEYNCIYSIVDMHAITVPQEPAKLRQNTLELLALYLAAGIDPSKSVLFVQSHVHEHAELNWALNTICYIGELSRMTQFKDKSKKQSGSNINVGLMNYPVLMAADILLYNSDLVPVGADQKQHLELARDLAVRFNSKYSDTFIVPNGYFPKVGAKIMSLSDPTSKMSKSDPNPNGFIAMTDDKDTILRKFRRAVTDSDGVIKFSNDKAGVSNLLSIFSCVTGMTVPECEQHFSGLGYAELKEQVGEAVASVILPIQSEQKRLIADKAQLTEILRLGREQASAIARKVLRKVYKKIGFLQI